MAIDLPFARAWNPIMHNAHLRPSEKLVLIELCRYWPNAYSGSNENISHNTGLCKRTVQYALKSLSTGPKKRHAQGKTKRRAYIDRGYKHTHFQGQRFTSRVILPLCLPGKAKPPTAATS